MPWNELAARLARLVELARSASFEQIVGVAVAAVLISSVMKGNDKNIPNLPIHYMSRLEPSILLQARFVTGAKGIIASGYKKFKGSLFIVRRFDADYNILPIEYLEEIRLMSPSILSGNVAHAQNMLYEWTDLRFLLRSHLHSEVLKRKLTPELPKHLTLASQELDYGWDIDVPQPDEWTEVDIQHVLQMLLARMSARLFVGEPACRDPEWLRVCVTYTLDLFTTAFMLRMFPTWIRPIVAGFLPSRFRLRRCRMKAEQVVSARLKKHQEGLGQRERNEPIPDDEDEALLDWMLDHGTEEETRVSEMASRQCAMTFASIHTISSTTSSLLFELCEHPEWLPVLREEIDQVRQQMGQDVTVDHKEVYKRLEKMDSFLLECFRVHPTLFLNPQRMALSALTLKDGTQIPKGCKIAFAHVEHLMDPAVTPDPFTFDPMRGYSRRHSSPDQHGKHQAAQTGVNSNFMFGYGNQACPGRFLGVALIKMLAVRLITEFDFKYPAGKSMPMTLSADENVFWDPGARLMMRKRPIK